MTDGDVRIEAGDRITAIERAADVLLLLAEVERADLGVTEISNELGIAKAVVHRILASLRDRDLVVADPATRRYGLGPAVLSLGAAYRERLDVRPLALDAMERLSAATSETATLSIRSGSQRIYVDQVTPPLEVRMTVQIGRPFPMHAGSSSKAFLAFLPEAEQRAVVEVPIDTALADELARIRERGWAATVGERQPGAASVAAPILDGDGPIAVISVCGPAERLRDRTDEIAELLLAETRRLSARVGHREP